MLDMIARTPAVERTSITNTETPALPIVNTVNNETLDKARALIPDLKTVINALLGHGIDQGKELFNVFINLETILEGKADFGRFPIVLLSLSTVLQTKKTIFNGHESSFVHLCDELLIDISKIQIG